MTNKSTVENQIESLEKNISINPLETEKIREYIQKERAYDLNTPLNPLFVKWESLISNLAINKQNAQKEVQNNTQEKVQSVRKDVESNDKGAIPVSSDAKDIVINTERIGQESSSEMTQARAQEKISDEQYASIERALRIESQTTATVRKNADVIVKLLRHSLKFSVVKPALVVLADPQGTVIQFQQALQMDGKEQDGWIGSQTIFTLLKKAGIPDNKIPSDIKAKAGQEKKEKQSASHAPVVTSSAQTKPDHTKINSLKANAELQKRKAVAEAKPVRYTSDTDTRSIRNQELSVIQELLKAGDATNGIMITSDKRNGYKGALDNPVIARVTNDDSTMLVWGEKKNDVRTVWKLDKNGQIIASANINHKDTLTSNFGDIGNITFIPKIQISVQKSAE